MTCTELYNKAVETMEARDIDHHYSDLYLRVNKISRDLVNNYEYKNQVETFIDQIDHVLWFDIPFAYCGPRTPDRN